MTLSSCDWPTVKFGDVVCQVKDKVDPETSGLDRYIAGEHMDTDDLRIRRWGEIGDDYLGPAFHMRFKPGQVLYGSRRTYLRKVAVPDFEGICANTTFVLEPKDPNRLLPELLPFIMQTERFHEHSVKQSKGSVNPYVNFSDLAWYEFALPPLAEQRRIAEVLQQLRRTEESIRHASLKLASVRDALIKDRTNAFELRDHKKLTDLVAEIEAGKSPTGRSDPALPEEHGVLKVSAVGHWGFHASENKQIDDSDYLSQYEVRDGDFLATRANADPDSVGRTCIVSGTRPGLMLSDKTWRVVFRSDNPYDETGILAWTKGPLFRVHILKHLAGTEAKNISQAKFLDGPFPNCTAEEFNSFAREIRAVLAEEEALSTRMSQVRMLYRESLAHILGAE